MDRALKERVVGAIVLVVLAVLIVPVFLDGPSNDAENIKENIVLPGQDEQSAKQKTIVLERERSRPVPAPRNDEERAAQERQVTQIADAPTVKPAAVPVQQAAVEKKPSPPPEKPKTTETKSPAVLSSSKTESTTGMWAVQLGSFSNQQNAERLAADLRKEGYAAFLSQLSSGSKQLHRVRIGPQKDRASAEAVAAKLQGAGHSGQVVPHP